MKTQTNENLNRTEFLNRLHARRIQNLENDILMTLFRSNLTFPEALSILDSVREFILEYKSNFNNK